MQNERIAVMQVIGGLGLGGAERMAVNIANALPRDRFRVYICATRGDGPMAGEVFEDVSRLFLCRGSRFREYRAVYELVNYIRRHNIRILHCHMSSVFLCSLASLFCPAVELIWHDHWGRSAPRPRWLYRIGTSRAKAVIACNRELASWAIKSLGFPENCVHFVRNFVTATATAATPVLPGTEGARIVSVGRVDPQKDFVNFVKAMAYVVKDVPNVQALIVGAQPDSDYLAQVKKSIADHGLENRVILLGPRNDVAGILANSDIGVLSSEMEGLPLALIEYGMAGLASVATDVGQCAEVLGDGRYGIVVPPADPEALAMGILQLLRSDDARKTLGGKFKRHTTDEYGPDRNIKKIVEIYDAVLEP